MAITVDEPSLVDTILFYGLFLGAIFQIICVMSVVFVPKSSEEEEADRADVPVEPAPVSSGVKQSHSQDNARSRGKKQNKKHR
ncbi:hypothetical protein ACOMHN_021545 [Nucella lapillus]